MFQLIAKLIINAISLYLVAYLVPGILVKDFWAALLAVVIIGLVNTFIKPVLKLLTLPITLVTLGLFTLVLNALLFGLAAYLTPGFEVRGILAAAIGSILFSIISTVLNWLTK